MVPEIQTRARRHGREVPRLLMPISFAAILGGTVTLIGTSTNLVVSGLLESAGYEPLAFFELAPLGIPMVVAGLFVLIFLAPRILGSATAFHRKPPELAREWVIDLKVRASERLDGLTIEASGLDDLARVELSRLETGGETLEPAPLSHRLQGGDVLRFVGNIYDVADLLSVQGLSTGEVDLLEFNRGQAAFFEAVIGPSSRLMGRNSMRSGLRSRYRAAMLAIHRPRGRVAAWCRWRVRGVARKDAGRSRSHAEELHRSGPSQPRTTPQDGVSVTGDAAVAHRGRGRRERRAWPAERRKGCRSRHM